MRRRTSKLCAGWERAASDTGALRFQRRLRAMAGSPGQVPVADRSRTNRMALDVNRPVVGLLAASWRLWT